MEIGAEVELVSREPYDGPITVKVDGKRRMIGSELARQIFVEPRRKAR
jgi:Fe2+ transport system protein FeoA